ncbi:MAG TPA: hypothetical protein VIL05_10320 [Thermoclostridium sp.]
MKITDSAVLFVIIALPFAFMMRIKTNNLQNVEYKNILLNRYLDTAVEDASNAMIIRGINDRITISKEKAVEAFYQTLYANLNITGDNTAKQRLNAFIPVIVIIDYDGYWIYSMETYTGMNGEKIQEMLWKPKKPYVYEKDGLVYLFTLDDYTTVLDIAAAKFYEGQREVIVQSLPDDEIIQDGELFEQVRKRTIAESIRSDVNTAINEHNKYAKLFGITYQFNPPSISDDDWQRNIEDIGILSFFQGIPIGLGGERFNSFALGAARVIRKRLYYIEQGENGLYYYHRENCSDVSLKDKVYDSREECALKGALPCGKCNP